MAEFEREEYPVCVVTGDTWIESIEFATENSDGTETPIDLTGRVPKIQVRATAATTGTPLLELTEGSGITFTPADGLIEVSTAITLAAGTYYWELEVGGSVVSSPLFGKFIVEQDLVRA